jgi:diacylglycerol kinase
MPRPWRDKFRDAFRGLWLAIKSEKCFLIHLPAAIAVLVAAILLRVTLPEACLLGLCVTVVLAAETFNTALEFLAREITREQNPGLGTALDMASGAVLITALGAAAVGGSIFLYRLGVLLNWWT